MTKYIALIRKEENTDYWVDIPDIPGCVSCGKTEDEALINFQEALELHLKSMKEDGVALSAPRRRDEVLKSEEDPYLKACLVDVPD